jgi:hypothetical protein
MVWRKPSCYRSYRALIAQKANFKAYLLGAPKVDEFSTGAISTPAGASIPA